jgi:hypothetical protein
MELGSELDPGNVSIFCLLGRDDIRQEVGPREEPTMMEDVLDVKYRKVDIERKRRTLWLGAPLRF